MTAGTIDRRIQKTTRILKDTLVTLLQKKDLKQVSVKALCEEADVSRGTFYLHYADIYALYDALEDEVVQGITAIIQNSVPSREAENLSPMIDGIFEYLRSHLWECGALLKTDSASFLSRVFESNRPAGRSAWSRLPGSSDRSREYFYNFICHGFAGVLRSWMAGGKVEDSREISDTVNRLISAMIRCG